MWQSDYGRYLYHHGILGQKWGKRNGPPYPLGSSDHSASEKKAGWRKSLDKSNGSPHTKSSSHGKSEKTAVDELLAAYGKHPVGKLDGLAAVGKARVEAMLGKKVGSAGDEVGFDGQSVHFVSGQKNRETGSGLKRLSKPETLEETLRNTNPNRGHPDYDNNCTLCSITAFLRQQGYDVTAGKTGGKQQMLGGKVEECFKGVKVLDGSAVKFGRSRKDATEMLLNRFGNNAEGVCGIQWKNGRGHAFNWKIKDGNVSFFDGQSGWNDSIVSRFWSKGLINPNDSLCLARLDNAEINFDAIRELLE